MPTSRDRLNRSESLHQQVARNLRNDIESGALRHGQALPSSRELAEEWGVSVFTITEAMKILAADGLVVNKSRSKRVVNAPDQTIRNDLRMQSPRVIIVGGYAGSGKTELGRILARETGWPMLDKDTLTRPVVEAALEIHGLSPHDRESDVYVSKIRPREYEALAAAIDENLVCGNSVIATAPFIRELNDPTWIGRAEASFAARGASTSFAWVYCDTETMHMYIRRRGAARDAAKLADWPAYLSGIDVDFRPVASHYVIDNSSSSTPLQSQARELLKDVLDAGGN